MIEIPLKKDDTVENDFKIWTFVIITSWSYFEKIPNFRFFKYGLEDMGYNIWIKGMDISVMWGMY